MFIYSYKILISDFITKKRYGQMVKKLYGFWRERVEVQIILFNDKNLFVARNLKIAA